MDNHICHISPEGGIDDRIAQFLDNGYSKEDIVLNSIIFGGGKTARQNNFFKI